MIIQVIVNSLITGSIYALVGSGLALTYATFRFLNFAHGQLLTVGAYLYLFFHQMMLLPAALSVVGTALGGALVALIIFRFVVFPYLGKDPLLPFLSTLALAIVIEAVLSLLFGVNVQTLTRGETSPSIQVFGAFITPIQIAIVFAAVTMLGALAIVIHHTPFGRKVRALQQNAEAFVSVGGRSTSVSISCFIAATLLACGAGILIAYDTNLHPLMGGSLTIKAFAAMVLGGLGNIWGTVLGSFIIGFIENFAISFSWFGFSLPAGYRDAVSFTIILVVLLLRPEGIFSFQKRVV